MSSSMFAQGLGSGAANHAPLTPVAFLNRTAEVFPDRLAIVHERSPLSSGRFVQAASRIRLISRSGGAPKSRAYSRLNCEALS
jgi:fatty-acyl-CoA synthase